MFQPLNRFKGRVLASFIMILCVAGTLELQAESPAQLSTGDTPRDWYNAGTDQLRAGKLPEAEELLQNSVASQAAGLQPLALYNLGCVRVAQGTVLLKKSKDATGRSDVSHVETLAALANDASKAIDAAIASENEQKMVSAYLRGGGIRREINAATKAVRQALEAKKDILAKWQRAAGDFRSAAELHAADADATYNAEATERAIAALIDKLNQLQQAGMKMNGAGKQLGQKMKGLKGMMPMPNMPPGAPGDEDEDEDMPGLKPGEQEGAGKAGDEMKISPEEAEQMLAGFKLNGEHRLPLGDEGTTKPKNRGGRDW